MKILPRLIALLLVFAFGESSAEAAPLKKDDIIKVDVFGEPSLSGAFTIGPAGNLVIPLLGNIVAAGKTTSDLASEIKMKLEAEYIRNAQVVVTMAVEAVPPPHSVTVIGQVMTPKQVTFPAGGSLDIFTAVALAGGLSERADRSRIELKRRSSNDDLQSQYLSLDDDRIFKLRDGDTLIISALPISELKEPEVMITVIGQVKSPGNFKMNPNQPFDLIAAIAAAGGFTDKARPSKVIIRRMTKSGIKAFTFNVTKMQRDGSEPFFTIAGDIITVPESIF